MRIPLVIVMSAACAVFCAAAQPAPSTDAGLAAFHQKDYSLAAQIFKQAAAEADPTAELMLGYLYENGSGVAKDATQASQWYALALDKMGDIARMAPSAKDAAFLQGLLLKAKDFVSAHRPDHPQASVSNVYTGDRYRDPFAPLSGGKPTRKFSLSDFSIHHLAMRGVMGVGRSGYALFTDPAYGVSFILKSGRLYDERGKQVPGVWGNVDARAKTAKLATSGEDIQSFRMGAQ